MLLKYLLFTFLLCSGFVFARFLWIMQIDIRYRNVTFVGVFGLLLLYLQFLCYIFNMFLVITEGLVRVTNKYARIYFLSFHLLCVIVVLK